MLLRGYTPGLVVTTVDAVNGAATLDRYAEAVQQVAMANRLLLTKPDLVGTGAASTPLQGRLAALNPGAPVIPVLQGDVATDNLTGHAATDVALLQTRTRSSRSPATNGHARNVATLALRLLAARDIDAASLWW